MGDRAQGGLRLPGAPFVPGRDRSEIQIAGADLRSRRRLRQQGRDCRSGQDCRTDARRVGFPTCPYSRMRPDGFEPTAECYGARGLSLSLRAGTMPDSGTVTVDWAVTVALTIPVLRSCSGVRGA